MFNNSTVNAPTIHTHLVMIFDSKLSFDEHLKSVLKKISKTVNLLRKFQGILPRTSLITIYKLFSRPHLDYGDRIYDQTFNESFHQRIESVFTRKTVFRFCLKLQINSVCFEQSLNNYFPHFILRFLRQCLRQHRYHPLAKLRSI